MSNETKEWLVEVVLIVLTVIAVVCARGPWVGHANSKDAPPASVNSNE